MTTRANPNLSCILILSEFLPVQIRYFLRYGSASLPPESRAGLVIRAEPGDFARARFERKTCLLVLKRDRNPSFNFEALYEALYERFVTQVLRNPQSEIRVSLKI